MGGATKGIILLTLLALTSPCSINEVVINSPCGGDLYCSRDFNDAKYTVLQMACLGYYEDKDPDLNQNFTISISAKDFDFFSSNDSSAINELNDHITDISITNGRIKKFPEAVSKLRQATAVDLSRNEISSFNLAAFSAPSKLTLLNVSFNNIGYLEVFASSSKYSTVPIATIDLSHNNIQGTLRNSIPSYPTLRHLNLSFNHIEAFDKYELYNMTSLLTLDISNNKIIELGSSLTSLVRLQKLFLDHNSLTSILKNNFYGMSSLANLNISSNSLRSIEDSSFNSLLALKQLDLSNNQIKVLSKSMFLKNSLLWSLDISFNNISKIEAGAFFGAHIVDLKLHNNTLAGSLDTGLFDGLYFEKLDLSDGDIAELGPDLFRQNPSFQSLNFSRNIISKISNTAFRKLHFLIDLDLSYNKIQNLEFDTTDLTNLTYFYLNNNFIKRITKTAFKTLTSVKIIDLSNNGIEDIEILSFENLKALHTLYLKNNPLGSIRPQTFSGLTYCYTLDLSGTTMHKLANNAFDGLESLNNLNLSYSDIHVLEYDVFNGTGAIEILDLSYNQIESFSVNNTNPKLQRLLLASNKITSIDETSFRNLNQVSLIDLSNNRISKIQPGSFHNCELLWYLNLSSNFLSFLQFGVFDGLFQLRTLDLSNNKLQRFDAKILYNIRYNIETVYLDNNLIDKLNFSEFVFASVDILSIGGNLIPCDALMRLKNTGLVIEVAARKRFYDTENVNGIPCKSEAELENVTRTLGNNALTENIYLEKLVSLNTSANRYLAAIFATFLCAMLVALCIIVYFKFKSKITNIRTTSSSREELSNAMELE